MVHGEETLLGASNANEAMHDKRGLMQRSFEYMFDLMEQEKLEAKQSGIEL